MAQDLEEQVRDLMVFIEAQRAVEAAGGSELRDGAVVALPPAERTSSGGGGGSGSSPAAALQARLAAKAGDRRRK